MDMRIVLVAMVAHTPLIMAIKQRRLEVVKYLLKECAANVGATDGIKIALHVWLQKTLGVI